MNQIVLYLSSTDSKEYYPNNNPADFTVKFPEPIQLHGEWTLTLRELKCKRSNNDDDLYIMCDAIQDTFVRNRKEPVLQYIPGKGRGGGGRVIQSFDGTIMPKVTRTTLNTLRIYIRDAQMQSALLRDETTTCALVLQKI